jgi:uncharacterized protein YkwD
VRIRPGEVQMRVGAKTMRTTVPLGILLSAAICVSVPLPAGHADNKRLNDGVVANVHTAQQQAGCRNQLNISPQLQLAAQRHAQDAVGNRSLDGDIGSDGSTAGDRAAAAGFRGSVAETIATNPALAISGIEVMRMWFGNPDYLAIMRDCAYTKIGVWSENSLDRTVVVAVYGQPQ